MNERERIADWSFCDMEEKQKIITYGDTIVSCYNRDRCAAIYEYMEEMKDAEN